jgi:hypothetical protein
MSIAERSIHDWIEPAPTLNPAASAAASVDGAAVDCADSDAEMFVIATGAWTDGTHTVAFFHRKLTTDSWVAVPAANLDGYNQLGVQQLASGEATYVISSTANQNKVIQVGYTGGQRYLKATRAAAGATTGMVLGVSVLVARQRYAGQTPMRRQWEAARPVV